MKRITVKLSGKALDYFNDVAYGLDTGTGKPATNSEVINHCLEELHEFEAQTGDQVTSFLKQINAPLTTTKS